MSFDGTRELTRVGFFSAAGVARELKPYTIPGDTELVELLTGGKVFFERGGETHTYGKGTIFWHRAGQQTIFRTPPENPYRCMVFSFRVRGSLREFPRVSVWNVPQAVEQFCAEVLSLHLSGADPEILGAYVYGTLARHALLKNAGAVPASYSPTLRHLLEAIRANQDRRISLSELARLCGVSRPYVFKLFRDEIGVSPHQYIVSLQLERARVMLASSDHSIKEIAFACGFDSVEVFYRRFRIAEGVTPGQYRNARRPYHFEA